MRTRRVIGRVLLGFLALVVIGVATILIVLHTDWGRGIVRGQVEAKLDQMFVGGAKVGRIEGSALGELRLRDVVINGPDGKPAITVKTLRLHLGILQLVSHEARVSGLVAEDVDVDLRRDPDGQLQASRMMRKQEKSRWSVEIPDLEVRRAHVQIDAGSEKVNIDDLWISAKLDMPYGKPLDARAIVRGLYRERHAPIGVEATVHAGPELTRFGWLTARVGDVTVAGTNVTLTRGQLAPGLDGLLVVDAPRAGVAQLVPGLDLPGDLGFALTATSQAGTPWTNLWLRGGVGDSRVNAIVDVDLHAMRGRGVASTGELDLTKLSRGKVEGHGSAIVSFDLTKPAPGKLPTGSALVHLAGDLVDAPPNARATIALSSDGERVHSAVTATGDGLQASISADLKKLGDAITLEHGRVIAHTTDPARASNGKAPVHGALHVDLSASGALAPEPSLAVTGGITGRALRVKDLSIQTLKVAIDARRLPARPLGKAELRATGIVRGDMVLRELSIDAADRADGKIQVAMRSRPKQDPWLVEADALVTLGDVVTVDLQRHRVRAGNGTDWTGTTGRLMISKDAVVLEQLRSASRDGALAVAGTFRRAGRRAGDLDAQVDIEQFALENLSPSYRGTLDARVDVARTAGRFSGGARIAARAVALDPKTVTVDLDATVEARSDKLAVDASVTSLQAGTAKLAIDIDAPKNVADVTAWRTLGRSAVRTGKIRLERIDVHHIAALAGVPEAERYQGRIDGEIEISSTNTGGVIQIRDVMAPALETIGAVNADLQISQTAPDLLRPMLTARVDGVSDIEAEAIVHIPERIFDPAAWREKGRGALHGATLRADEINIDPALLDRFHVTANLRGRASFVAKVTESIKSANVELVVRDLRGGQLVKPVTITARAAIDETDTTSTITVQSASATLVEATGRIPVSIDALQANPRGVLEAPLAGKVTIPDAPAPSVLQTFGRTEIIAGRLAGTVDVTGTVGKPVVKGTITGTNLQVPPGPGGKPIKTLEKLTLEGSWDGAQARLAVDGTEQAGSLRLAATVDPNALAGAQVELDAKQFDLIPLLVFAPGPAGGAAGRLDAKLRVTGLDPQTMKLAGEIHLVDARLPIAPAVGTLRRAKIDIVASDQLKVNIEGMLGSGKLTTRASFHMAGAMPTDGTAKLTLRKVSPIGVVEPKIDADIDAKLFREDDHWASIIEIRNGHVVVPKGRGEKLDPPGAPPDMRFAVTGERITRRPMEKRPPAKPKLVATIKLYSTYVESEELRGLIHGRVTVTTDGQDVGIIGDISADRGDLDLFGHRYQVERAAVHFDGTPDPRLDMLITHDFADVTTRTQVRGRLSKPELIMASDPPTYSQTQLLGFLLGGEPGGEPGDARDRATAAGASYVANKLGGYVKSALPIDLDVLRYEAATSQSSAAITAGTWLTRGIFVAYRRRLESRADENSNEGQVEYWISRRVRVEATAGDRGYDGVDLLWRKRY